MSLSRERRKEDADETDEKLNTFLNSASEDCSGINCLPDCLLLNIFSRLEFHETCICKRVCRKWRRVANDSTLKKTIIMKKPLLQKHLRHFINTYFTDHLKELKWGRNPFDDKGIGDTPNTSLNWEQSSQRDQGNYGHMFFSELSKRCINIKKLEFFVAELPIKIQSFRDLPPSISHLDIQTHIRYSCSDFSRNHIWAVDGFKSNQSTPTIFNLTCFVLINCRSQSLWYDTSLNFEFLKALYVKNCFKFVDSDIEGMIDILPQLEILDIEGTCTSKEGIVLIFKKCVNIRELFIGHLNIDDDALVPEFRKNLPRLSHLCVRGTYIITSHQLHEFFLDCPDQSSVKVEMDGECELCNEVITPFEDFSYSCQHYLSHKCPK